MIKALEIAKRLDEHYNAKDAAAELRRLHELNAELVAVLNLNYGHVIGGNGIKTGLEFAEMIKRTEALLGKAKEQA